MRKPIKCNFGTVQTYDKKTGKLEKEETGTMMMLPAREGTCAECATEHDESQPHNPQIFYQYHFYNRHARWPTWKDAMSHCKDDVKKFWIDALKEKGIFVEGENK